VPGSTSNDTERQVPTRGQDVPFPEAVNAWVRVAASSFGGPAAQISIIHRVAVEEKRWIDEHQFLRALSFCMLLPGPEAQQLATYLGWKLHGLRGGLTAGLLFILPGFVSMLVLSMLYVSASDVAIVAAMFYGLKPAVLPVVLEAVVRLKRRAAKGALGTGIAAAAFIAIFAFKVPFPVIVIAAGLVGVFADRAAASIPSVRRAVSRSDVMSSIRTAVTCILIWLLPVVALLLAFGPDHVLTRQAAFFSRVAVVTFGGAYAVLAYVAQRAVDVFGWLTPGEMLDGLGLAETTPGPLIMVVQFVAFLGAFRNPGTLEPVTAGILGSLVTVWVTFAPSFMFILVGAPWVERLTSNRKLAAALSGITAAVVGVILNLAVWFAIHTLFTRVTDTTLGPVTVPVPDLATFSPAVAVIAALATIALFRFRIGMLWVLAGGAALGVVARVTGIA
jgi:chromate transporter